MLSSSIAYWQPSKDGFHSCVVEWMGGGWYSSSAKR
jgi:hypothetical protein